MTLISKNPRFELRLIKLNDAEGYYKCHQDIAARKNFMSVPRNVNEAKKELSEEIKEMKKKNSSLEFLSVIVDEEFAGFVMIHSLNRKQPLKEKGSIWVISVGLLPQFRGKGLASKVLELFTDYCFKKFKLKRITGRCRSFNKASAKTMEKAGYKFEGMHKKEVYKNGKYYDNLYYARVK